MVTKSPKMGGVWIVTSWKKTVQHSLRVRLAGAVVELIIDGVVINRDAIVDSLEAKRRAVGNVIHKGVLRDAAAMVRKGQ